MQTPRTPLLLMLVLLAIPALADVRSTPARIDAFGTGAASFVGVERLAKRAPNVAVNIRPIDGVERIQNLLGDGLPAATKSAERTALKRLQAFGPKERKVLQRSADALLLAWQYDVRRHPAIVFDGRYVVYGVTDLEEAYALYHQWHEASGS